jgi:uncharacterized protein YbaA (DUF1428 family)
LASARRDHHHITIPDCERAHRQSGIDLRWITSERGGSSVRPRFHEGGNRMSYVDGFVVPVPKKNLAAYKKMAKKSAKVWREYGALDYREWVADDVKPGKRTSFPQSVKLKPDEVVVFSYIVYKNKSERDKINKAVMADPRLKDMMNPKAMPFDAKRMFWGGFKSFVEA